MLKVEKRAERKDKKKEVKPTITIQLKDCISRISYISDKPVKDVAATICEYGISQKEVLDLLAKHFRRSIKIDETLYVGDLARSSLQTRSKAINDKVSIRFRREAYEFICSIAHALDVTPTRATALILNITLKETRFIDLYFQRYLSDNMDEMRVRELEKVIRYLNDNSDLDYEMSWGSLMSMIYEEAKLNTADMKDKIKQWLHRHS